MSNEQMGRQIGYLVDDYGLTRSEAADLIEQHGSYEVADRAMKESRPDI